MLKNRNPYKKVNSEAMDITQQKKTLDKTKIEKNDNNLDIAVSVDKKRTGISKWTHTAKKIAFSPILPHVEEFFIDREFKDIKQPVLFLIRSSLDIDRFEGVSDGIFKITTDSKTGSEKEQEEKGIILNNSKLLNMPCGIDENGEIRNLKCWFGHEDEAITYPIKPKYDASVFVKVIEKIYMNAYMLNSDIKKGGMGMWLEIGLGAVMVLAIGGYIAYKMGIFDPQTAVNVATTTAKVVAQNITASQTGVRIQ